jgi:hypothetical protein
MDVALVIDNTGSMGGAINDVKAELPAIVGTAQAASCGDLRIGLVTFPEDNVVVSQPFTTNITAVQNAIQAIVAGAGTAGAGEPESSDEALQYVITGAAALDTNCSVVVSNGPFGTFRPPCVKIAVLITDAHPGGCDDKFTVGVDDVHAHNVALAAANAGILIAAIYVPTSGEMPDIKAIMQDYANTSGGTFVETESNGVGTGEGIADIVATCGGLVSQQCVTRTAPFWFEHAFPTGANTNCPSTCADLLDAIKINGGMLNLGFTYLPTTYRDNDNILDANDALIEALGFYWRGNGRTGEDNGTQNLKLIASALCRARKLLAVELIAATANVKLLDTSPSNCYDAATEANFPADLLRQARDAAAGEDVAACLDMTKVLQRFNNSGVTNNFLDAVECSVTAAKALKKLSRDPTTQDTCPGRNDSCVTAEAVTGFPFKRSINTSAYSVSSAGDTTSSNAVSGHLAWYKIEPDVGQSNRWFTANTAGSNFDTLLTVWQGTCNSVSNSLSMVAENDNNGVSLQSRVQFSTDGTNTYYIVVGSSNGGYGRANIKVTSP